MCCDNKDVTVRAESSIENEIPAVFNLYQPSVNGMVGRKMKFPLQMESVSQNMIGVLHRKLM